MGLGIQKRHMHLPGGCGAGAGLLTFSHTVRIVSAYVSHTQTPFCAHLTILCSRTALYRSRSFILYVICPRKANDACAGATIHLWGREPRGRGAKEAASQTARRFASSLRATGFSEFPHSFRILRRRLAPSWPHLMRSHGVLAYAPEVLNLLFGTPPRRIPGKI